MKKVNRANIRVRKNMCKAMITLMNEKNFSEITITDLVEKAGVGRPSYYRNYSTKEEVIEDYLLQVQEDTKERLQKNSTVTCGKDFVVMVMEGLKRHKDDLLVLYHAGFSKLILNMINENIEMIFGDMPSTSVDRYKLSCLAGIIFNTEMMWLESGAKEECDSIANIICNFNASELLSDTEDRSFAIFSEE